MRALRSLLRVAALLAVLALVGVGIAGAIHPAPTATAADAATSETDEGSSKERSSSDDKRMRRELRDLARAWGDGGGRFGYPFWEKAGQRWRHNLITTTMYREYVTGYRDRLKLGCDLLEGVEPEDDVASDVRELLRDSCRERVDALRAQERALSDLIARDDGTERDEDELAALDARIAEREETARQKLQASYRDARIALDLAQSELDSAQLERLPEDAFI